MVRDRTHQLAAFRPWLIAAAIYNLVSGTIIVIAPALYFRIVHIPPPNYLPLWQVVGMFVLVYSPGYWWAYRAPAAHSHLVLIGLLGKLLGPIGFAWSAWVGQLPLAFGAILVSNDLLWWPAFIGFVATAARLSGGWRNYLLGKGPPPAVD
jgi:hypothetical protein